MTRDLKARSRLSDGATFGLPYLLHQFPCLAASLLLIRKLRHNYLLRRNPVSTGANVLLLRNFTKIGKYSSHH